MKNSIYLVFFILTTSCKTVKNEVICTLDKHEIPVKLLEAFTNPDSTYITLMIPKKVLINNNYNHEIRLSNANLSIDKHGGGNREKYGIYGVNDSLNHPLYQINFKRNQKKEYLIYLGYKMKISNTEREKLLETSSFSQYRQGKKVYNLGLVKELDVYLQQKIPDSLRGYLTITFRNDKINGYLKEAVPVEF